MYEKKQKGDRIVTKGREFDPGKLFKGDRVRLKNGEEGTISIMVPLGQNFLIEFEDLEHGATNMDVVHVVESGCMGRLMRKEGPNV